MSETATQFDALTVSKERANLDREGRGADILDDFMEEGAAKLSHEDYVKGNEDMVGYLESRPSTDGKDKFHDPKTGAYISREDANAVYSPEQGADVDEYASLSISELLRLSAKAENNKDKTTMLSVDDAITEKIIGMGLSDKLQDRDGSKREQSEQDKMLDRVMKLREKFVAEETNGASVFPEVKDKKDGESVDDILQDGADIKPGDHAAIAQAAMNVMLERAQLAKTRGDVDAALSTGLEDVLEYMKEHSVEVNQDQLKEIRQLIDDAVIETNPDYDGPVTPGMELVPFEGSEDEPATPVGGRLKQNIKRRWLALRLGNFGEALLPETRKGKIALAIGAVALAYGAYKVQQNGGDAQPFINGNGSEEIAAEALDSADASGNANSFMDNSDAFMGEAVDTGSAAEETDGDTLKNALSGGGDQGGAEIAAQNIGSDVDVSNYSWTVAHELSLGGETELMNDGLEQYNQANGTAFALTPHEGSTWIMDGNRAIQQAEMENLNRIMVEISKGLAKA